jgi:hypothetical protein
MLNKRAIYAVLLAIGLFTINGDAAVAGEKVKLANLPPTNDYAPSPVSIGSDRGGVVIQYGLRMLRWRQNGTRVRFSGSCQSACTLYLGLAPRQMCISSGASFGFHSPSGATGRGNSVAQAFMMRNYPAWVRAWIRSQGGLSGDIKTMRYSYASQFIAPCESAATYRGSARSGRQSDG